MNAEKERTTTNERIAFDDENCDNITQPTMLGPQESEHWKSLVHHESDKLIHTLEELKDRFRSDVNENSNGGELMAIWSCVSGYCEALATHKEAYKRYSIFPIPIDALERLVKSEFWQTILDPAQATLPPEDTTQQLSLQAIQNRHRLRVRAVANAVWDTAVNSSKKDEEHANSLYVCLRGKIDRKSIDCLGSSVATVAGVKLLQAKETERAKQQHQEEDDSSANVGFVTSMLTLSEDHAYERHVIRVPTQESDSRTEILEGTCEVAIPGSTKRQKAKRACEIADTFRDKKACVLLTPESSWLYMATNPVVCSTVKMSIVPIVANINCNIRSKQPGSSGSATKGSSLESRQLYRLKRELLWILYDEGAMEIFPFGILELGDCEGTVGSKRGEEWVTSKSPLVEHSEPIMRNEELFLEAIGICRRDYRDSQVYPYYYAGHYHKDAGGTQIQTDIYCTEENNSDFYSDNEHRFVDALRMYSEASRVSSKYRFDTGDCLQLNKHLTSMAALIYEDILTTKAFSSKPQPRAWIHDSNARACCFWLLRFLDCLLFWEEWSSSASSKAGLTSKNPRFVEILQPSHKSFVGKLLQTFDSEVRSSALDDFFLGKKPTFAVQQQQQQQQGKEALIVPVSKRLGDRSTLLAKSLVAAKIQIRDMDLVILDDDDKDDESRRRGRSSKRRRKS